MIDWQRAWKHIQRRCQEIEVIIDDYVDSHDEYTSFVFLENYPPRIEIIFGIKTSDGRRAETYLCMRMMAAKPTDEERMPVAELMAQIQEIMPDLRIRHVRGSRPGFMTYTIKPIYDEFSMEKV